MKQPLTVIEADPQFSYTFVHTTTTTMHFLLWATGHLLLGAGIYSFMSGSDRLLAAAVDGSLFAFLTYGTAIIVASSVVIGMLGALAQLLAVRVKVLRTQRH